jgi:hypothetical protein
VLVVERVDLELDEHVALQDAAVKDQIDEAVRVAEEDALLCSDGFFGVFGEVGTGSRGR